jgi:hypothetical protein
MSLIVLLGNGRLFVVRADIWFLDHFDGKKTGIGGSYPFIIGSISSNICDKLFK